MEKTFLGTKMPMSYRPGGDGRVPVFPNRQELTALVEITPNAIAM
jgi:hypothetical protein